MTHPVLGTRCRADEAFSWSLDDPDLRDGLTGHEVVELQMIGTSDTVGTDDGYVAEYRAIYTTQGVGGLPPLWAWEGGKFPLLITGAHRSTAAYQAGITEVPAWVVMD